MRLLRGWIEFLKSQKAVPEHSVPFRLAVGGLVTVGLVATADQLEWPNYALAAIALTWAGLFYSYHGRHRNNWGVKAVLSVLMIVTLLNFFRGLAASAYDPRVPLAELLIWLQTLHSWDVPARKDLNYSMLVALILISLAAVLTFRMSFFVYLVLFVAAALAALHFNHLSRVTELTGATVRDLSRPAQPLRLAFSVGRLLVLLLLGAGFLFLLMPRYQSMRLRALPVSWEMQFRLPKVSDGQVVNPSYPQSTPQDPSQRPFFSEDSYFGFNPVVDLNTRGVLSEEIVMKVRSSGFVYYRGLAFDHYDGRFWTVKSDELRTIENDSPPLYLPGGRRGSQDKVQIYYIERTLPNVVFAGLQPAVLYFPSQELYQDTTGSLRAPFVLEEGMVYSVISFEPELGPEELKKLPSRDPALKRMERYLELPDRVPERVRALARRQTEGLPTVWSKATALAGYLQANYIYNLAVPHYPSEAETVDHFLFEIREGYCEQFATALVVLCRAAGIHARYVTGYLPGTYNPFTGFYEVKGSEAHAWAEVFIPNLGWMTFDPVPGQSATPSLSPPPEERWFLLTLLRYLGLDAQRLKGVFVPWRELLAAVVVLGLGLGMAGLRARRPSRARAVSGVAKVFLAALAHLEKAGYRRDPAETPRAFCARLHRERELPELVRLGELFEKIRYAEAEGGPSELAEAKALLRALRLRLRERR